MVKILIVDDDRHIRRLLEETLKTEGYEAVCASTGDEAISVIENEPVDLIILDIMLPGKDGYEISELIRLSNADLPILMISAKQLPIDRHKAFLSGCDDYMSKPLDIVELVLRVKALLRRAKIATEKKIVLGDVVIDCDTMTVTGHGQVQTLPQKEFQLLYKLLAYPNQIFTRRQLMDEVWGFNSDSGWETVTVHIGRLRKRFEGFDEFEIQSIRGLGYRAVKKESRNE